jgi:hypothetical protein
MDRRVDLLFSCSGCSVRTWRTVHAWSTDRPLGARTSAIRPVLHEFLRRVLSIHRVGRFRLEEVGRTALLGRLTVRAARTVRSARPNHQNFGGCILEARGHLADCLPLTRELSPRSTRTVRLVTSDRPPRGFAVCLSPLLLELRFLLGFV